MPGGAVASLARAALVLEDRLLDEIDGVVVPPRLTGEDSQQMEGVRVVRVRLDHLAVLGFGFVEAARIVVADPFAQSRGNRIGGTVVRHRVLQGVISGL